MSCKLGCTERCKAREHGCPSECPALPWQPPTDTIERLTAERDAALARAEAAERDAERSLSMYRALRERMQAAMQETIEEQPR